MNIDRRQFTRHRIRPNTIFLYSNYAPVQGWAKDISKEGMAFEYILSDGCEPKPKVRLILTGDTIPFYLPDLFCKAIYDIELDNNNGPHKKIGLHRCGVKYEKLDPEMQEKLIFLLNSKHILQEL